MQYRGLPVNQKVVVGLLVVVTACIAVGGWFLLRDDADKRVGKSFDVTAVVDDECELLSADVGGLRFTSDDLPPEWRGKEVTGTIEVTGGGNGERLSGTFTSSGVSVVVEGDEVEDFFQGACVSWPV